MTDAACHSGSAILTHSADGLDDVPRLAWTKGLRSLAVRAQRLDLVQRVQCQDRSLEAPLAWLTNCQPQGDWGSTNGLENGGWSYGPNEYLANVWGVPTSGYPDQWNFGNNNVGSGTTSGNFIGRNSGPGIGHGGVGNGISDVGSGNGGFGSATAGLANGNPGLASGVGDVGNSIGGIGSGGFGRESMGLAGGNTGFGSGDAGFISSGLGTGSAGFTSSNGVFGTGNITPGTARGLA
ncbi:hypothetical protein HPB52_016485 [Rhipicephalus sanguineus]|uniref:Uncharacterized protein n=1 Tax=Rhipicephalus sanguineus TaxID=34632 RepID=A0A9D4SSZ7_RHISA|nr:hypothetical protein HPB52_016485 [Rhipicephalus sanguineus]